MALIAGGRAAELGFQTLLVERADLRRMRHSFTVGLRRRILQLALRSGDLGIAGDPLLAGLTRSAQLRGEGTNLPVQLEAERMRGAGEAPSLCRIRLGEPVVVTTGFPSELVMLGRKVGALEPGEHLPRGDILPDPHGNVGEEAIARCSDLNLSAIFDAALKCRGAGYRPTHDLGGFQPVGRGGGSAAAAGVEHGHSGYGEQTNATHGQ